MRSLPPLVSPAEDPRASRSIARAKAWCGLAGFVLAALAADLHGDSVAATMTRALLAGVIGNLLGWLVAMTVWRRLMRAETRRAVEIIRERNGVGDA